MTRATRVPGALAAAFFAGALLLGAQGCGAEARDSEGSGLAPRATDDVGLLVAEAERRGMGRTSAARGAEKRVLAQLVLRDLEAAVGPGDAPDAVAGDAPATDPAAPREHRLVAYVRVESAGDAPLGDDALELAAEVLARMEREGLDAVLEDYRERPPAHPRYRFSVEEGVVIEARDDGPGSLRAALFAAPGVGPVSPAFRTARGAYAAHVLAVWPDVRPSPEAEAAEREAEALVRRRERALHDLGASLRASTPVHLDEEALAPVLGIAASSE